MRIIPVTYPHQCGLALKKHMECLSMTTRRAVPMDGRGKLLS
jgi:hypothetical protein